MSTITMKRLAAAAVVVVLLLTLSLGAVFAQDPGIPVSDDGIVPIEYEGNVSCQFLGYSFGFKIEGQGGADYTGTFPFDLSNGGVHTGTPPPPDDPYNSVTLFSEDGYYLDWMATLGIDAVIVKGGNDSNAYVYIPEDNADAGLASPLLDNGNLPGISHVEFCYDYELTATKTAKAEYTRTYTWEIDKDFDGEYWKFIGDPATTHGYKVSVDQTVADSAFAVSGTITVKNPTPFPVDFSVSDSVGGIPVTPDCPTYSLAPNDGLPGGPDEVICTYSTSLAAKMDGINVATISSSNANVLGATAEAFYAFDQPTTIVGDPTVNVTDTNGEAWLASGDASWEYNREFTCPTDLSLYEDGYYKIIHTNTATIIETGQFADATVIVYCYAPAITKDATASYDERHIWDVEKTVDPESQSGFPGDVLEWTWTVDVSETFIPDNFAVNGKIKVKNPAGSPGDMTVSLVDQLNDGTFATVDCGGGMTSITVVPGDTGECTYAATPGDKAATENKAIGMFNGIDFVATAEVSFEPNVINGTAIVRDDKTVLWKNLIAGKGPWSFPGSESQTCSTNRADYFVDDTYKAISVTIENWAYVYSGGDLLDRDDATTTWTCNASFVDIIKTTNDVIDPAKDIRFKLYDGAGVDLEDEVSTLNDADGQLQFQTALVPGDTYTVCESPVPAGYTFEISVNGGNVLTYAGPPGEENPTGEVQCFDFVAAASPTTLVFNVNNSYPGGAPRTPGYWKNWNTCTGGNQAATAAKLGGVEEGVFLLDNLLPQLVGDLNVNTCEIGVYVLSGQTVAKVGKVEAGTLKSNDAAYTLARAYLAALLNQDAGACVPTDTYDDDGKTFQEVLNRAQQILDQVNFVGTGDYLGPKVKNGLLNLRNEALALYEIIDDYNNSELCTGEESH
jgi:hypothetical protein